MEKVYNLRKIMDAYKLKTTSSSGIYEAMIHNSRYVLLFRKIKLLSFEISYKQLL